MKTVFNDNSPFLHKALAYLIFGFFGLTLINLGGGAIYEAVASTPGEKIEQERRASCERIRAKEELCHTSGDCNLKESAKWHAATFGESISNCFSLNAEDLVLGVGRQ